MAKVRVPRQPKTLAEQWAGEIERKQGQTLVEIFALEDSPERACPKCKRYVDPFSIHVVDDTQPWHMKCWYATYQRNEDGSLQMKMF